MKFETDLSNHSHVLGISLEIVYLQYAAHLGNTFKRFYFLFLLYIFFFLSVFGFLFTPFQFFSFVNELPPRFFWGRPHIPKR